MKGKHRQFNGVMPGIFSMTFIILAKHRAIHMVVVRDQQMSHDDYTSQPQRKNRDMFKNLLHPMKSALMRERANIEIIFSIK